MISVWAAEEREAAQPALRPDAAAFPSLLNNHWARWTSGGGDIRVVEPRHESRVGPEEGLDGTSLSPAPLVVKGGGGILQYYNLEIID